MSRHQRQTTQAAKDICTKSAMYVLKIHEHDAQKLLEEQSLKVIDQCNSNIQRPAVLKHILPEGKVRQERQKMALEIGGKEVLCFLVGLHLGVIGE
jgi:hypothetical protein